MALTVRREGVRSSGTLSNPIAVAIDLSRLNPPPIERRQLLGYEAIPSTAVYGISSPRRFELQLTRDGSDRYAVHIQITVINSAGQAVAAITRADGQLNWLTLPAGDYRIIAALLIPEQVELGLTIEARPARTPMPPAFAAGSGGGVLRPGRGLSGQATGDSPSLASATQPHLQGRGDGVGGGTATLLELQGATGRVRCSASGSGSAAAQAAAMQWVDGLGRPMGSSILIAPVALSSPVLVRGTDWSVTIRLVAADGSAPRDLTGITFSAEIWDSERLQRYATCDLSVGDPLAGGPVTAALTPEQSALVGRYSGEVVVFDLWGVDGSGTLAYLITGQVSCIDKVTVWDDNAPPPGEDLLYLSGFAEEDGDPLPLTEVNTFGQLTFPVPEPED